MIEITLTFAIVSFSVALLCNLYRVAFAPGVTDRILALDTMVINAIGLLTLYGIVTATPIYFEVTMLIALVGFVSTVAYCRFILRGNIIE